MINKTREQLVKMYIDCLKEDKIPWRRQWDAPNNFNGISRKPYRGVNFLILMLVSQKEKYKDPRWYTYLQVKKLGYKLKPEAKGKGVPVEFWSYYNLKTRRKASFEEYEKSIEEKPENKENFKIILTTSYVFNGLLVDGLEKYYQNDIHKINIPKYISNIIKNIGVGYEEIGGTAYYDRLMDKIVLPPSHTFVDKYSYYATQLHELSHASGSANRLNRNIGVFDSKENYAREELVAEISSSFLMQKLNVTVEKVNYDDHKAYIQSWIKILKNKPKELFEAINKANEVCDYLEKNSKTRKKDLKIKFDDRLGRRREHER